MVEFEWDEVKNKRNFEKHGFSFEDADAIFQGVVFSSEDNRKNYGEKRFLSVGALDDVVVVVAHTIRGNKARIISIRRANKNERKIYQERTKEVQT